MKKSTLVILYAFSVYILAACNSGSQSGLSSETEIWMEETLDGMSLEEKVGQVFCPVKSPAQKHCTDRLISAVYCPLLFLASIHMGMGSKSVKREK